MPAREPDQWPAALGLILLVLTVLQPASAGAQEFDQGPVFTIIEENDLVVDTDRHYTQGIKLSFLQSDGVMPRVVRNFSDWLPQIGFEPGAHKFGYEIGQSMFTPADLGVTELIRNDRPYAGWLYTGLILQRRGWAGRRILTLEHLQIDLGIIGPESLAEEAQTWVHELRGFALPQGWKNQLKDEPGLALKYARLWRFSWGEESTRYFDFLPQLGGSLGNVETSLRAGGTVRLGYNLPDDFGAQTISSLLTADGGWSKTRKGGHWGFYLFTGVEGWIVGHNAFLDGNLYRESHHVDKEPFVAEWKTGAVWVMGRADVGFTYVYRTREFIGQSEDNGYGSAFMKVRF